MSMKNMFEKSQFNQDISEWDVSNITDMSCLFKNIRDYTLSDYQIKLRNVKYVS